MKDEDLRQAYIDLQLEVMSSPCLTALFNQAVVEMKALKAVIEVSQPREPYKIWELLALESEETHERILMAAVFHRKRHGAFTENVLEGAVRDMKAAQHWYKPK